MKINAKNMLTKIDENPQNLIERVDRWDEIHDKLYKERVESFEYLDNCLSKINENQ